MTCIIVLLLYRHVKVILNNKIHGVYKLTHTDTWVRREMAQSKCDIQRKVQATWPPHFQPRFLPQSLEKYRVLLWAN